ncbi:MAG: T9SS type A sorting domain-containing protein [Bacteroidales bacterium]|nr:T9SS type A sorting domain-containing protein [Bacteroidales bacterium]
MKKTAIVIVLIICHLMGHAQALMRIDTTYSHFFYFDYMDYMQTGHVLVVNSVFIPHTTDFQHQLIGDFLQYNYSEQDMEIVGIAGYFPYYWWSTPLNHPEYFLLYDATPDSFPLLAKIPWEFDSNQLHWTMLPKRMSPDWTCDSVYPFEQSRRCYIEKYFDEPIVVKDSFYVGGTCYGALDFANGETVSTDVFSYACYENTADHPDNQYSSSGYETLNPIPEYCLMTPQKWKIMNMDPNELARTELGYYTWKYLEAQQFLLILPIIARYDTTYYVPDCPAVTGLGADTSNGITLSWNRDGNSEWQVAYGQEGLLPDECAIETCHSPSWSYRRNENDERNMQACVRTVCRDYDSLRYGPWSYSITWANNDDPIDVRLPQNQLEKFVHLIPNPAHSQVDVLSSFRIKNMETYSLSGKHYGSIQPDGNSASLDVSGWPKGVYLISITTDGGNITKKLIVE